MEHVLPINDQTLEVFVRQCVCTEKLLLCFQKMVSKVHLPVPPKNSSHQEQHLEYSQVKDGAVLGGAAVHHNVLDQVPLQGGSGISNPSGGHGLLCGRMG
jgi:hypothetical protein